MGRFVQRFNCTILMLSIFASSAFAQQSQPHLFPLFAFPSYLFPQSMKERPYVDPQLVNWIKSNISLETQLPLSFHIPEDIKKDVYAQMGEADSVPAIIERVIVEEGLIVYDGAVGQIVLTLVGGEENLRQAFLPLKVYWDGKLEDLASIRAGYPVNQFIYDPKKPEAVSSDLSKKGERGFIFRIINANGRYNTSDPLDGKTTFEDFPTWPTIHWEDWKPVAGENAWVAMSAMHLYHKKYFREETQRYEHNLESIELQLAEELARAALLLQADNGGIRMAPLGTYRDPKDFTEPSQEQGSWWYTQISSENNISWYAAFRMLYEVTGKGIYKEAMNGIERFFLSVWNPGENYFYQGTNFTNERWRFNNDHFALDVQTWGINCFGPEKIDEWFGEGAAYQMWKTSKKNSGYFSSEGELLGVGYIREHDRLSVEWTAGAIIAAKKLASYYDAKYPQWSKELFEDAGSMRKGIDRLKQNVGEGQTAYSYSSKRGWIPFGWYSHSPEVLSLASTGWVVFVDADFNPFYLPAPKMF